MNNDDCSDYVYFKIEFLYTGTDDNFDEEILKYQPSLEVEDAEEAIYSNDIPDITELIKGIIGNDRKDK